MAEMILVVDDETEIADLVEVYLKNEGYLVKKASCAAEALHIADTQPIALALLDVMLPDLDGFTLCRKIREKHLFPLIMLTAKTEDVDKITGLTLGADDYITKPFNPLEVVARVKTQLRRYIRYNQTAPEPAPAAVYDCGGLYIDHESHTCTLYSKPLSLTLLEFEILWYLCSRKACGFFRRTVRKQSGAKKISGQQQYRYGTHCPPAGKMGELPASPSGSKRYGAWGTRSMNKQTANTKTGTVLAVRHRLHHWHGGLVWTRVYSLSPSHMAVLRNALYPVENGGIWHRTSTLSGRLGVFDLPFFLLCPQSSF